MPGQRDARAKGTRAQFMKVFKYENPHSSIQKLFDLDIMLCAYPVEHRSMCLTPHNMSSEKNRQPGCAHSTAALVVKGSCDQGGLVCEGR